MHDTINGAMFKEMLLFGTVSIAQAQQAINDLNVFPVPDGDTGTNMSLTIQTAAQELKKIEPATVDQAASVTASALLRGARGNSGVILSLLFRGIAKELKGCKEADGAGNCRGVQAILFSKFRKDSAFYEIFQQGRKMRPVSDAQVPPVRGGGKGTRHQHLSPQHRPA